MDNQILTVKERPRHHAIGRFFYGFDGQVCYCDSYDPRVDFWMTNVVDSTIRRPVSPRAIGRTYHSVDDDLKPLSAEDIIGRQYFVVDTRVAPDVMKYEPRADKDCMGLDERIAIFFWEGDAKKFIERVKAAAEKLKAKAQPAV
jgi:hypothetical protein